MLTRQAPRLVLASIVGLLLLAAAACTGGGEPEAAASPAVTVAPVVTPTPTGTTTTSPTVTASPGPPVAVTGTATPTPSGPVDISFGEHTLTEGRYKYSLRPGTWLFFDVPGGLQLSIGGQIRSEGFIGGPESFGLLLRDIDSRSWITLDLESGREWSRWIDPAAGGIRALFDQITQSARVSPPPTPTPTPRALGTGAEPFDISGWQFTDRAFGEGVYQFAPGPRERPLVFEVPPGLRLKARFTGPMPDDPSQWCPGLLLMEVWNGSRLCLDVDGGVELSRTPQDSATEERFDRIAASLRLGPSPPEDAPSPCAAVIMTWTYGPVVLTGGNTYLLPSTDIGPLGFVAVYVPVDVQVDVSFHTYSEMHLTEETSGSRLIIDLTAGEERERELLTAPSPYSVDVGAAFDEILESLRFDWPRPAPGCPAAVVPGWGQTIGEGSYSYHFDPHRYHGMHLVPHVIFDVPARLQVLVEWDEVTAFGIRLSDVETDSWLCLNAELVEECGRSITPGAEHLGPLFDAIAESLRPGSMP